MNHRKFLSFVLVSVLMRVINGESSASNETDWKQCSPHCNCSLANDLAVAKCDITTMEQCESFLLPDETSIL